jgi:ubiquinone/menaquinone biosynthesis C-methylase UbiE
VSDYILPQAPDREREKRRLALIQEYQDGPTIKCIEQIGILPGAHCLDAGAGGGSISRWLADQVGDHGSVLALDLDTTLLEDRPRLTACRHDLRVDPLPAAAFDMVHTRLVLTHLAERERVLAKLVRAVRPGGVLVVGDFDFGTVRLSRPDERFDLVAQAYSTVSLKAGGDPGIGPRLPEMLERYGVEQVHAEALHTWQPGNGIMPTIVGMTFERIRPQVLELGVDKEDLEYFHAALRDPSVRLHSPEIWTVWGTVGAKRRSR